MIGQNDPDEKLLGAVDIRGWGCVVQNRESPDFRSLEVGRYAFHEQLNRIFADQPTVFKINFSFGFILRNTETGALQYYHPSANNHLVLEQPFLISRRFRVISRRFRVPISVDSRDRLLGVGATAETKFKMGRGSRDECYLVCLEDSTKWPIWFGDTS